MGRVDAAPTARGHLPHHRPFPYLLCCPWAPHVAPVLTVRTEPGRCGVRWRAGILKRCERPISRELLSRSPCDASGLTCAGKTRYPAKRLFTWFRLPPLAPCPSLPHALKLVCLDAEGTQRGAARQGGVALRELPNTSRPVEPRERRECGVSTCCFSLAPRAKIRARPCGSRRHSY